MEEAKNKEKTTPDKNEEKEKQPAGKDKEKKEEQELVGEREYILQMLGTENPLANLPESLVNNMVVQAQDVFGRGHGDRINEWMCCYSLCRTRIYSHVEKREWIFNMPFDPNRPTSSHFSAFATPSISLANISWLTLALAIEAMLGQGINASIELTAYFYWPIQCINSMKHV